MPMELRPLVARLGLTPAREEGPIHFRGSVGGIEVVAALTGVGMRAGAECAARVLGAASPDHLVVVGVAGGIGESVGVGDLVVPELVLNRESGESFRPDVLGAGAPRGILVSSDRLLESPAEARRLSAQGAIAVDMETAAIGAVCVQRGCPWSVFRAISDRADDGSTDAAVLALAGPDGRPDLRAVARFLLTRPHRIPQLVRLARGANAAARNAAAAAVAALVAS
jgi:adenosylhomocysteine nucleosidase